MVRSFAEKIRWLGHDTFRIDAGKTVYFDPYEIEGGPVADLILVSHDHFDHCAPEDVARIQGTETVIVTEKDSAKKLTGDVRVVKPGDTLDLGELKVEAVPAYNTDKDFHPKKNGWLGFI
ncbi:MAG TPA: MBL fold metallo-hydrolase, partial [Deltaproteobacteria bacterium]|nr:MBL fold metallo-hydrolase [Deltaproteobacteria bacterium]